MAPPGSTRSNLKGRWAINSHEDWVATLKHGTFTMCHKRTPSHMAYVQCGDSQPPPSHVLQANPLGAVPCLPTHGNSRLSYVAKKPSTAQRRVVRRLPVLQSASALWHHIWVGGVALGVTRSWHNTQQSESWRRRACCDAPFCANALMLRALCPILRVGGGGIHWVTSSLLTLEHQPPKHLLPIPLPTL